MDGQSIFIPVYGLELGHAIKRELRIDQVTFIHAAKIPYVRKRFGIERRISEYNRERLWIKNPYFSASKTYAVVHDRNVDMVKARQLAQEALWIFAASMIGTKQRGRFFFSLRAFDSPGAREDWLVFPNKKDGGSMRLRSTNPFQDCVLDKEWKVIYSNSFFRHLIQIINNRKLVKSNWRNSIKRAAILAGRSYVAQTVHDAFICTMIAIETLLAQRNDKFPDALIDRITSLFGWLTDDDLEPWRKLIDRLYSLRCSYVHDGISGNIEGMDIFNADVLLSNLFMNICENPNFFRSKGAVLRYAEEVRCKRVLGLPLRPKNLRLHFSRPVTSEKDIREINKVRWAC